MSYESLSLNGFINEVKDVSSGPHPRKFCFILGAGASKSSGIKSGQELVDIWDKELSERNFESYQQWKKQMGITDDNKYSYYSQYYEKRFERQPLDGYNYLEKMMEHTTPSIGYVVLSHILANTSHNVVITTNFDHLTEDALNYYTQTLPLTIGHEVLAHYINKQINRPTIIKIHRDLLFDPKNRTTELEKLHENWGKALDIIFSEYHPIFIGYAGNDKSVIDFLIDHHDEFTKGNWKFPYWTIYKTEKINEKVQSFLDATQGYLIKQNGFDEIMCLMGAALGYKLPSEENFMEDARKRYNMLSNAMDQFTAQSTNNKNTISGIADNSSVEINQAIEQIIKPAEELQKMYWEAARRHNSGDYTGAVELERKLIEYAPANARYHDILSVTLHIMKQYEEALQESRKAVELEPENAEYHDSLGVTLYEMGRYEEALQEKERAVELEPENAEYHNSLGVTLHKMERHEEALREKERAIELEPKNAEYHNSLGVTLHKMERYEEALQEKGLAIELEPENAKYHNSLGITLHKMKRYEEALQEVRKALELDPKSTKYRNDLDVILNSVEVHEETPN